MSDIYFDDWWESNKFKGTSTTRTWCEQAWMAAKAQPVQYVITAPDEITRLKAELAEAQRDAARYLWLRENFQFIKLDDWIQDDGQEQLDAAIDAAMSEGRE